MKQPPRRVMEPGGSRATAPRVEGGRAWARVRPWLRPGASLATWLPLATLGLCFLAFVALPLPTSVRVATGHLVLTALPLSAGLLLLRNARTQAGHVRGSWSAFGVACLIVALAQALWAVPQVLWGTPQPFPSLSFFLFLSFHPIVATGVVLALPRRRATGFALEIGLDALLVLLASLVLLLRLVLEPLLRDAPWLTTSDLAWSLVGQVLSIGTMFFAGLLVVWREPALPGGAVVNLASALSLNATTTLFLARHLDPDPTRPGHAFTLLWVGVWLLVVRAGLLGLEAHAPALTPHRSFQRSSSLMRRGVLAGGVLVLGAAAAGLLGRLADATLATRIATGSLTIVVIIRAVVALRGAEREVDERRTLQETRALVEVSSALAAAADLPAALTLVAEWARRLLHARGAAVELKQGDGGAAIAAAVGSLDHALGRVVDEPHSVLRWLDGKGVPLARTVRAATDPRLTSLGVPPDRPAAAAPLHFGGRYSGTLVLELDERMLDNRGMELLRALAEQAATAVESQRLLEDARLSERQRLQSEKLSLVGQLAGGIAHELNNPLAAIHSAAELLSEDATTPDGLRLATLVRSEARRAGTIVRNLLELVRPQEAAIEAIDVAEVLEDTLQLRAYAHGLQSVQVSRDLQPLWPVRADRDRLRQVFLNLVVNAEQAMEGQPIRRMELRCRMLDDVVEVTLADTGPGIAPDYLERIFEPFFTTKAIGQGTGLGLSITHRIVRDLGGTLSAGNRPEGGALFTLRLPACDEPRAGAPRTAELPPANGRAGAHGSVLVVDDEAAIREVAARSLRRAGYVVQVAESGESAIELLQRHRFDVIVSDIRMPGLGGEGLYRTLQALRIPALDRFIFISGDIVTETTNRFLAETGRPYLMKPFELSELLGTVRLVAEEQRASE